MAEKKSLLEDLYTDSGGVDAERAAKVLTPHHPAWKPRRLFRQGMAF